MNEIKDDDIQTPHEGEPENRSKSANEASGGPDADRFSNYENDPQPHQRGRTTTYRGILDAFAANICIVDNEGQIIAVNQAWNQFARQNLYSEPRNSQQPAEGDNELAYGVGANYFDICQTATGSDAQIALATAAGLRQVLNGERERFSLEYPCHSPDKHRWYLLTISPLDSEGGGAIVSHFNITEQIELRHANQTLDAFGQSLALAFRTPLATMRKSLTTLSNASELLPAELQEQIEQMVDGTEQLDSMVRDLLSYSLISRTSIALRPTDLHRSITEALKRYRAKIEQSNAHISVAETIPYVAADPVLLTEVLSALISNALKFTAAGKSPEISIRAESHPEAVWLWVEDCGIGIEENESNSLFPIFKRSAKTLHYPGNGIGLALVEKSMRQMKGFVEIMPGEDGGTRVKLVFPKKTR